MKAITFNKEVYDKSMLKTLTDKQIYETALNDAENTFIYDDLGTFQTDLNDGYVDIIYNYVCFIND